MNPSSRKNRNREGKEQALRAREETDLRTYEAAATELQDRDGIWKREYVLDPFFGDVGWWSARPMTGGAIGSD